jgi:hypothetical protein
MLTNKFTTFKDGHKQSYENNRREGTDIVFIQELYNISNMAVGLPRYIAVFTSREGRKQAAIVRKNKRIDFTTNTILRGHGGSGNKGDNASLILVSMYFDINRPKYIDLQKMQKILTRAKGTGTIFPADSNARSTTWHDVLTNKRGKALEEFLISRQLFTANEESCYKTFQSGRGAI